MADLLDYVMQLQVTIERHDADKASLKSWYASVSQ
nr:MAG TPA: hypothetical protein [Caudoviricetes sp.]